MDSERNGSEPKLVGYSPLRTLTLFSGQLARHREKKRKSTNPSVSIDLNNVKSLPDIHGMSLIQAARDGQLAIVKAHLDASRASINDVDEDGFTALHYAARYNRVDVMRALVNAGADINVKQDQDEVRPLHLACRYNCDVAARYLLECRAGVNIKDIKGRTPLHYATRRGHGTVIKVLISVSTCNVNEPDNDQTTPLIMAALQGNADICETLIFRGADIEKRDINDMTALMWASAEGHTQVAKVLLKSAQRHGPENEIAYIRAPDKEGNTALHLAVQNGSLAVVNLLLSHGADVNSQKNNLATPLHLAATCGFLDIAKVVVYNGANIDSQDIEQLTPMHRAALYNKVEILEFLVKRGGNLNAKDKKSMSPLHCACWKGQTEAADFLLSNGAQVAEVDIELKTALHWTVEFSHYDTLLTLLKYGGRNLLGYTDKNDQTVLHYAAFTGDEKILKMLLEVGSRPDAKDQDERSPLHIAAQKDNVACVEALINASNHETNDDDMDGRTPLLLACFSGHHQAVQVLMSLGSDVSRRDDEHWTALMLAAAGGHALVMKILLENHASVNDVDKMKNTALHYACQGGHIEAVRLLLDKKADVTVKNTYDHTPIDLAIDNLRLEVVSIMLRNKTICQSCLNIRDLSGRTIVDRLIAKLPDAAMIVLDHCLERTSCDDEENSLTMTFDYQYVDPGPDDPSSTVNRYFALNTMVKHGRDSLLSHPLCQNLLSQKWFRFGRQIFYINLLTYLGYLSCLTVYVCFQYPPGFDSQTGCANFSNTTRSRFSFEQNSPEMTVCRVFLYIFLALFFLRDIIKIVSQRWKYLFNIYNIIVWILMITTLMFITDQSNCLMRWQAGWIAMFVAWINFIMYLRRIDLLGIYVIMFVTVLSSLLKVVLVFLMFASAFAGSFYIVMQNKPGFSDVGPMLINIVVMTLGEIEYIDGFLTDDLSPFYVDALLVLLVFLFLMPLVLMNLMIGVAVGDIEKIQRNAYLKRIGLQVDLMYNIENNMPKFVQKAVHVKRAIVKPNEPPSSMFQRFTWYLGSARTVQFIEAGQKDQMQQSLETLSEKMRIQQLSIKSLHMALQQQSLILTQLANRFDVHLPTTAMPTTSSGIPPYHPDVKINPSSDSLAIYDGSAPGNIVMDRRRQRSVRASMMKSERPKSTVI